MTPTGSIRNFTNNRMLLTALSLTLSTSAWADFTATAQEARSIANAFTANVTAFVTPNADTPYSFVWMDLRAEPLVLTLPPIEEHRYYSVQLIDAYTQNFAYLALAARATMAAIS